MNTSAVEESVNTAVRAFREQEIELNELRAEAARLRATTGLLEGEIIQYQDKLAVASSERDHYMRYATEVTAQLGLVQSIIAAIVEAASHMAYRSTKPTAPPPKNPRLSEALEKDLKRLVEHFKPNGGGDEHLQDEE